LYARKNSVERVMNPIAPQVMRTVDERRALQGVRGDLLVSFLVDQVLDLVEAVSWVWSGRAKPA